ncbi:site-specific integrase [Fulvivirga sediminis]|uniref:Site-specific integrase n=1 Tax=Fulvivirga sediminis TaxID=2803949 RepID=A0A937F6E1_9BACT|nr:site-specific integrase [Fulvivirga sediminis]MBL3655099.1 site-specific integrase [Fulvivirga sediminis]
MRSQSTFGFSFYVKKYKKISGQVPIYVRITVNGHSVDMSIKRKVHLEDWDAVKSRVRKSSNGSDILNSYMGTLRNRLYECIEELEKERKIITADAIKNRYTGQDQRRNSLLQLVEYHNREMNYELKEGTMKNYRSTERYIRKFLKSRLRVKDIYLEELNYGFIKSFERYIRNNPLQSNLPCTQNGTMKHMERLCKMMNLALREEWITKNPFIKYQLKFRKTERCYLNHDELQHIESVKLTKDRLVLVRDVFVFACYTGLSYIDTLNLSTDNIIKGVDNELWITGRRQKSDKLFSVPLLPKALSILKKYKHRNDLPMKGEGKCLPVYSNQKTNQYLKELAVLCGINKNLTFHTARHTFATTITLANDIPIETVSEMLGHTKLSTTQIYAKVIKQKISRDMAGLREKLR